MGSDQEGVGSCDQVVFDADNGPGAGQEVIGIDFFQDALELRGGLGFSGSDAMDDAGVGIQEARQAFLGKTGIGHRVENPGAGDGFHLPEGRGHFFARMGLVDFAGTVGGNATGDGKDGGDDENDRVEPSAFLLDGLDIMPMDAFFPLDGRAAVTPLGKLFRVDDGVDGDKVVGILAGGILASAHIGEGNDCLHGAVYLKINRA